jgi:hypothetical protein
LGQARQPAGPLVIRARADGVLLRPTTKRAGGRHHAGTSSARVAANRCRRRKVPTEPNKSFGRALTRGKHVPRAVSPRNRTSLTRCDPPGIGPAVRVVAPRDERRSNEERRNAFRPSSRTDAIRRNRLHITCGTVGPGQPERSASLTATRRVRGAARRVTGEPLTGRRVNAAASTTARDRTRAARRPTAAPPTPTSASPVPARPATASRALTAPPSPGRRRAASRRRTTAAGARPTTSAPPATSA